jgi:hypothetical protein
MSELTVPSSQKSKTSTITSTCKRKIENDIECDTSSSEDEEQSTATSNKKQKVEKTDIEFNIEERKYFIMKVRSGDTITSPCWSSKLCHVGSLSKEGIELMKKEK